MNNNCATMNTNINILSKKKTMGRRKIEIKKIEKKSRRQVTFCKRRTGLFTKASELSVVSGAEIAILMQSPAKKVFAFGHPSVDAVIARFQNGAVVSQGSSSLVGRDLVDYEEAVRRLEKEKRVVKEDKCEEWWWDKAYEGMQLDELQEYVEALEDLRDNVVGNVLGWLKNELCEVLE